MPMSGVEGAIGEGSSSEDERPGKRNRCMFERYLMRVSAWTSRKEVLTHGEFEAFLNFFILVIHPLVESIRRE